jgi:hypothetical protein
MATTVTAVEPIDVLKAFVRDRFKDSIAQYERVIDVLGPEEKKAADKKMAELQSELDKLDECKDVNELVAKLGLDITTEAPEQDMNFPDILIPYEELKKMDEKDIMVARTIVNIKFASEPIKIVYGLQTPLTHIDYVEEKLKELDYVTLDRPEPRMLSVANKNAGAMGDKTILGDMADCLGRIYYGQLQKLRKEADIIYVDITSLFNLFDYVKSKGYNVAKTTDTATSFTVTID